MESWIALALVSPSVVCRFVEACAIPARMERDFAHRQVMGRCLPTKHQGSGRVRGVISREQVRKFMRMPMGSRRSRGFAQSGFALALPGFLCHRRAHLWHGSFPRATQLQFFERERMGRRELLVAFRIAPPGKRLTAFEWRACAESAALGSVASIAFARGAGTLPRGPFRRLDWSRTWVQISVRKGKTSGAPSAWRKTGIPPPARLPQPVFPVAMPIHRCPMPPLRRR